MVITFKSGKIIATMHEIVVKLTGEHFVTLQSQTDAISLIGNGANVVTANGAECKWSIKLDNHQQLEQLAEQLGISIQ
ncbi:conserved hypothetical protein [Vibrio nigripulchritudo SFn27]|uniref:Phosphotransferase system IIA component n=1 Tax=Vibrio nigripulchritudo TaxID=28173 RepID=U4KCY1_9VIBR|nr:DUF3389 domain-containing protein [Vibrio nigripulchritudo]CCN81467.1 conserved hypothetical protein [Vibrio nigripulchritudo BLFn1]CCN91563.1 conserved hypothetical protein [Vibrio nigripulchritudo SFn27]CCN96448.1 conserved hypothetical protein [Vibrio nigripulchritudo ENn2]CCO38321.1 conserved hypothetical protein [Vibrio nigripulchritudo SFn135]CCO53777.1 conserved hypothetical protein [Vibrio nigripulchritudo Wn13]